MDDGSCWHASLLVEMMGSPLVEVVECMRVGKFYPAPTEPVGEQEIVVGELLLFEKSLFTIRMNFVDDIEAIAATNNAMLAEAAANDVEVDIAQVNRNKLAYREKHQLLQVVDSLLWARLRRRLGTPELLAIREGYSVAKRQSQDREDFCVEIFSATIAP